MIHMIFELLVSSARICAYTSATAGACAVAGCATRIKPPNKNAQTLAMFSLLKRFTVLMLCVLESHANIHFAAFAGNRCKRMYKNRQTTHRPELPTLRRPRCLPTAPPGDRGAVLGSQGCCTMPKLFPVHLPRPKFSAADRWRYWERPA